MSTTKKTTDYEALYKRLKGFVKRQIKDPKWIDKTAVDAWKFLEELLPYWETCQMPKPTSWRDEDD